MDRLTPEEFEELFNAYNSGLTEDILSSPNRFDKLKDINKETAKTVANKRAEKLIQAGLTPNLDAFMPNTYTQWNHWGNEDDRDTIMDTISYANMLSGGKDFSKDSLEKFSNFITNLYSTKSLKKKYSKDDLYKIYTYFSGLDAGLFPSSSALFGPREMREPYRDYRAYAKKYLQAGATAPTFETFLEDKVLGNPKVNLDNKLNTLNRLQGGFDRNYQRDTLKYGLPPTDESDIPETPKVENETSDTTPQVETKSTEDIGDLYTYTMNRLSKDKKYRKLGWWE